MLRETALNTKRLELGKCVGARKRKISELYHVAATVAATVAGQSHHDHINNIHHDRPKFTETEFQDANDITLGRYFDIATLRPLLNGDRSLHTSPPKPPVADPQQATKDTVGKEVDGRNGSTVPEKDAVALESRGAQTDLSDDEGTPTVQTLPNGLQKDASMVLEHDKEQPEVLKDITGSSLDSNALQKPVADKSLGPLDRTSDINSSISPERRLPISPPTSIVSTKPNDGLGIVNDLSAEPHREHLAGDGGRQQDRSPPATTSIAVDNGDGKGAKEVTVPLAKGPALTPDAQLRQEAAQFTENQSQDTGESISSHEKDADILASSKPNGQPQTDSDSAFVKPAEPKDSTIAARRKAADQRIAGMANVISKDMMLCQRPPMRIDTAVGRPQPVVESSTASTSFTPLKSAQAGMASSPPERMTTRVSSGALRHKSVSEILGETPKSSSFGGDRSAVQDPHREDTSYLSRRSSLVASPESAGFKSRFGDFRDRDKDRSKLSTVVFARQQAADRARNRESRPGQGGRRDRPDENKDYLVPLFAAQAAAQQPTLSHLMQNAHKTLSTANHYVEYHEQQDCRILKRIYHLQNSNRWSLRQFERSAEPPRLTTHWDELLAEGKWMRTDFREERKWKLVAAKNLAECCAEWVASPDERSALQVKARIPLLNSPVPADSQATPGSVNIRGSSIPSEATPELVASAEDDLSDGADDELPHVDVSNAIAPAALFSLTPEDVLFSLDKTPVTDKLLSELPFYQPFSDLRGKKRTLSEALDSAWKKPLVPVSKYAIGKILIKEECPRRKRSRFDYAEDDEGDQEPSGRSALLDQKKEPAPPEKDDVALFNPKNKHIIARLHAAHAFRPPSEFNMPTQSFFESRFPSQWTLAEDDELRRLVREYEYNWSLISACLSSTSLFSSGAERRTPWECFERWESFEGLPGDMDKHSYFRAWKSRRMNAKQHLEQAFMSQQQAASNPQAQTRRRSSEPVHVERRRNAKHLALIHGMSKVAKKKETTLQKQQHVAQLAALRKAPEPSQPRLRMQTPQEFSAHKYKQECDFKEKQIVYRQQIEASRRAVLNQQRAAQQAGQQQTGLGLPPQGRVAMPGNMNGTSPRMVASLAQSTPQANGRPMQPSQQVLNGMMQNGIQQNGQMTMRGGMGVPQAQMQSYLQGQQQQARQLIQGTPDPARIVMEAARLQEQQRMMQQRQFQTQANGHTGVAAPPLNNAMNHQLPPNAAMMANMNGGKVSPANGVTGVPQRSSNSPIGNTAHNQQLSSGMVPLLNQIQSHLKAMNPNATPEQIRALATQNLNQRLQAQNSQVNASLGGNGNVPLLPQQQAMGYNGQMNSQMYAQFMRSQQASQQNRHGSVGEASAPRPDSRGTASLTNGVPSTNGTSQSPQLQQAQIASSSSS